MVVFSGMLIATILGVLLIPMLYVAVGRMIGGRTPVMGGANPMSVPVAAPAPGGVLAAAHPQRSH
jgi:hypothetical protein